MDTILHQVKWDQLDQLKEKDFCTNAHHQIQVMKETIPIIFVPGIMGSRLANKQKKIVWDPSYPKSFMVPTYSNITPADRKRLLIEDPSVDVLRWGDNPGADKSFCGDLVNTLSGVGAWDWLPPEIRPSLKDIFTYQKQSVGATAGLSEFDAKLCPFLGKQGWSEISFDDYVPVLKQLSSVDATGAYSSYFYCPVYAFGYNFLNDNRVCGNQLANRIFQIIQLEGSRPKRYCKKVILVSHSMGGLVVRSALHFDGAGPFVLGVLHGAQPVSGAPAAYRRMRAGTEHNGPIEHLGAAVLGIDAEDIVPVLANCVGGLELLPTSAYKDRVGNTKWLFKLDQNGKQLAPAQPLSSNPYNDIYVDQNSRNFLRLLYNPDLLVPEGVAEFNRNAEAASANSDDDKAKGQHQTTVTPISVFVSNVTQAYNFQLQVTPDVKHPNTYQGYSVGNATFEHVSFKLASDQINKEQTGFGIDLDYDYGPHGTNFALQPAEPKAGDSTVPESSALALQISDPARTFKIKGVSHQDFFSDSTSLTNSFACIQRMLDGYKKDHGC